MDGIVREGADSARVQVVARQLARAGAGLDPVRRVAAIRHHLGAAFEYVRDPDGVEELSHPDRLAAAVQSHGTFRGDCDDLAIFAAAVGRALHYPARFIALATGQHGLKLDHVLTEWRVGDTWVSMDTIIPNARRLAVHTWRL
jgi:transglutaminase-like putative cysteine protease